MKRIECEQTGKHYEKIPQVSDEVSEFERKGHDRRTSIQMRIYLFRVHGPASYWSLDVRVLSTLALTDSVAVGTLCNGSMISRSLTVTVVVLASRTTKTVSPELW